MESNGKKVIIVDEQPHYIVGLKKGLLQNGYEVYYAEDGDSALALTRQVEPDIILSEVHLPQLDGLSLLQTIRNDEKYHDLPFIFLSNQKKVEDRIKSIQLGVDDYIQKPYFVEEVIARIGLILSEKEAELAAGQLGSFAGNLSEMNLIDLIQTLELGNKSGILTLKRNGKQGQVQIQSGNVVNARFEQFSGEEALERMFTWTEGFFQVLMTEVKVPQKAVKLNNKQLVEHGLEKVTQWESLKTQLPPLNSIIIPMADIPDTILLSLTDDEQQVLEQIDGKHSILELIEQIPRDEIESLQIFQSLLRKNLIQVKELKQSSGKQEQQKNSQYIKNIKSFIRQHVKPNEKELSIIRLFFKKPITYPQIHTQTFEGEIPDTSEMELLTKSSAMLLNSAISKQKNRIHLTKSELMMIREMLM